jgi:hypothetical protein
LDDIEKKKTVKEKEVERKQGNNFGSYGHNTPTNGVITYIYGP